MKTIDITSLEAVTGGTSTSNQLMMTQMQQLSSNLAASQNQNNNPNNQLAMAMVMGLAMRDRGPAW